jgi:hypothetical protein
MRCSCPKTPSLISERPARGAGPGSWSSRPCRDQRDRAADGAGAGGQPGERAHRARAGGLQPPRAPRASCSPRSTPPPSARRWRRPGRRCSPRQARAAGAGQRSASPRPTSARAETSAGAELNAQADVDTAARSTRCASPTSPSRAPIARPRPCSQTRADQPQLHPHRGAHRRGGDPALHRRGADGGRELPGARALRARATTSRACASIANVDEADIARLREGMAAEARVDAFPANVFRAGGLEVRFGRPPPTGVVTYPTVIEVANPDLKLRPGMTATITVSHAPAPQRAAVPNAALRYRPAGRDGGGAGGVRRPGPTARAAAGVRAAQGSPRASPSGGPRRRDVHRGDRGERRSPRATQVVTDETDARAPARGRRRAPGWAEADAEAADERAPPVIEMRGIEKVYTQRGGGLPRARGVTLEVARGSSSPSAAPRAAARAP